MPISIYFIGDKKDRRSARSLPAVFVERDGNYDPPEVAMTGRKSFVVIDDPWLFKDVDDYLCSHGLYDRGDVTILDKGGGVKLGTIFEAIVFLTDDMDFARGLKNKENAGVVQ